MIIEFDTSDFNPDATYSIDFQKKTIVRVYNLTHEARDIPWKDLPEIKDGLTFRLGGFTPEVCRLRIKASPKMLPSCEVAPNEWKLKVRGEWEKIQGLNLGLNSDGEYTHTIFNMPNNFRLVYGKYELVEVHK